MSRLKDTVKYISRKYFSYDPSLRLLALGADFLDQKKLVGGREDVVIFDVGANIGQTAQKYRKLFPRATIHSFEPFPEVYGKYLEATRGDNRTHPHHVALSDKKGSASFFANDCHYTNSLLPVTPEYSSAENYVPTQKMEVPTDTLDNFCRENNIGKINILKMDVQGGEKLVLEGAKQMLSAGSIDLIYTEVEFEEIYKGQPLFDDLKTFLEGFGYRLHDTYNLVEEKGKKLTADAIFLRK